MSDLAAWFRVQHAMYEQRLAHKRAIKRATNVVSLAQHRRTR